MKTINSKQIAELVGTKDLSFAVNRSRLDDTFPKPIKKEVGKPYLWDYNAIMEWSKTYKRHQKPVTRYKCYEVFDNEMAQKFIRNPWWNRNKDSSKFIYNITKNHCSNSEWV